MFRRRPTPDGPQSGIALRLSGVSRIYGESGARVAALDDVSLVIPTGAFTAVMGPSGSGKSTFLHCAAGLDRPTSGAVEVAGSTLIWGNESRMTRFRRDRIGFVFQQFNLLPTLNVFENAVLPLRLAGRRVDRRAATGILERVGLADRLHHRPSELSGGQQQRVAVARALIARPPLLFADEPTGALDSRSSRAVLGLLREVVRDHGQTVVMVTHDPAAAATADDVLVFADGRPIDRLVRPDAATVAERVLRVATSAGNTEGSPR